MDMDQCCDCRGRSIRRLNDNRKSTINNVQKINLCYFRPQSFETVCYIEIDMGINHYIPLGI